MNYQRIHDAIIDRARNRTLHGYREKHHVIPRCLGGTNQNTNLVNLTAREHFIIHKLLCEIYPINIGLIKAYWMMANKISNETQQRDYIVSSREYHQLKERLRDIRSNEMRGNTISKGNIPWNKGKSVGLFGDQNPAKRLDVREKISKALKGRQLQKIKCPHCSKDGQPSNMYRWHFDYCKLNLNKTPRTDLKTCPYCKLETTKVNSIRWHFENSKNKKHEQISKII